MAPRTGTGDAVAAVAVDASLAVQPAPLAPAVVRREGPARVGLFVGREWSWPPAFIEAVNSRDAGVVAEFAKIGGAALRRSVSVRRAASTASRTRCRCTARTSSRRRSQGATVVNNPFMWTRRRQVLRRRARPRSSASRARRRSCCRTGSTSPASCPSESLRNLEYPLDWQGIADYVGLPCILKDAHGGGWKEVYICHTLEELIHNYNTTGLLTMIVQEFIEWEHFVRCLVIGRTEVLPMKYDPKARKYIVEHAHLSPELGARIVHDARKLCNALGYDMNSMEFAIRDGVPYAIDFMNSGAGHGHQLAHAGVLPLGGRQDGRPRDPPRHAAALGAARGRVGVALRCRSIVTGHPERGGGPVAAYHELLAGSAGEQLAADTQGALDGQLLRRGLVFGDRKLCTVLRPRLYRPEEFRRLTTRVTPLMRAFGQAFGAAMREPGVLAQFRLAEWEHALLDTYAGFGSPSPTSRLDLFVIDPSPDGSGARLGGAAPSEGSMALTEYNGEVPAGAAYADALAEAFMDVPAMREFARTWRVWPILSHHGVVHVLLDAWRQFSGTRTKPRIAILDWRDVPTYAEFVLYRDHFTRARHRERHRRPARQPSTATASCGATACRSTSSTSACCCTSWCRSMGLDNPVLRAVRERAVCMVNSPRSKILHKKASLAVLSDERNASFYDAESQRAIDAFVPWTRVVEERRTTHGGRDVDLIEPCEPHRERLVLKPNDDYGGAGIVLGWTVTMASGTRRWRRRSRSRTSCRSACRFRRSRTRAWSTAPSRSSTG